jgi:hypothetical protein
MGPAAPRLTRLLLAALFILLPLLEAAAIPPPGRIPARKAADPYAPLVQTLAPRSRVAVTDIYDGATGNDTALSHLWRDRAEQQLRRLGVDLVARLDIALVDEDNQIHGGRNASAISREGRRRAATMWRCWWPTATTGAKGCRAFSTPTMIWRR